MCPPQVYVSPKYERWREPEISPLEKCPFRVASRRTCPRCYHRNRARLCQELNAPKELRKRKSTLPRDGGSSANGMRQQQQRQSRGSRLTASQRPASSSFERTKKRRGGLAAPSVPSDSVFSSSVTRGQFIPLFQTSRGSMRPPKHRKQERKPKEKKTDGKSGGSVSAEGVKDKPPCTHHEPIIACSGRCRRVPRWAGLTVYANRKTARRKPVIG